MATMHRISMNYQVVGNGRAQLFPRTPLLHRSTHPNIHVHQSRCPQWLRHDPQHVLTPRAALTSASSFDEEQPFVAAVRRGVQNARQALSSPYDKEIIAVAIPALVGQLMEPVVGAVNAALLGHLGTHQLSAVSLANIALNCATFIFSFLIFLTVPETAAAVAKNDKDEVSRIAAQSLWVALGCGCLTAAALFCNAGHIVTALRPPEPLVAELATQYMQIRSLSVPAVLMGFVATGVFRGFKDTRTPLYGTVTSVAISLCFHLLLLNVLHLGAAGAAVATALASVCSCGVMLGALVAGGKAQLPHLVRPPPLSAVLPLLQRGAVLGTRSVVSFGMILFASTICVRQGSAFQASFEVIRQMWMLSMPFFECINVATQALCASALGKQDRATARSLLNRLLALGLGIACLCGSVVWLLHEPALAFFTTDPRVAEYVMSSLPVICLCFPLDALGAILDGSLLAAKQSNYMSAVQIVGAALQYLGLLWVVSSGDVQPMYIWLIIKLVNVCRVVGGVARTFFSAKSAYLPVPKPAVIPDAPAQPTAAPAATGTATPTAAASAALPSSITAVTGATAAAAAAPSAAAVSAPSATLRPLGLATLSLEPPAPAVPQGGPLHRGGPSTGLSTPAAVTVAGATVGSPA